MQVLADRSESLLGSQVHTNSKGAPMGYVQNTEQASLSNYTRLSEKCLFFKNNICVASITKRVTLSNNNGKIWREYHARCQAG